MFKPKSILVFLLFVLLILTACKKKETKGLYPNFQIPELKDTFKYSVPEYLFLIQESMGDTNNIFKNYFFEPHFFGKEKQTFFPRPNAIYRDYYDGLLPGTKRVIYNKDFKTNYDYYHSRKEYATPSTGQLNFQIDFKHTKNHFTPLFIKNNCIDTFNIGFGEYLDIDILVLNDKKEWIQIDRDFSYYCGTGLAKILLLPKQILLTYLPELKKGNFKTEFRLRLGEAYSESYPVSIDESILQNLKNQN